MQDETHINNYDTRLFIEDEPFNLFLDNMEKAYEYELWQCLQKLTAMEPKVDALYNALETVTEADVYAMWHDDAGQFILNQSKLNIDKLG